jgi:MSHA biogenesis protein MshI
MQLFRKFRRVDGLRAICFKGEEVRVAHVSGGSGKRAVALIASERLDGHDPAGGLSHLSRKWNGEQYECTMLVNPGDYQMLPVEAPNVPPSELKTAISFVVMDMLDFHIDQATIDVIAIPQDKNAAQRGRGMLAVAIRTELIGKYQSWFNAAKLPLRVIDIPDMAQRNIAALLEPPDRGLALVSFDVDGGLLTLTAGGELYQSRRIDVTLAQILHSDTGQREVAHERVALEIQRSLDNFGRQFSSVGVAKLMVAPIGDDDGGLVGYLAANLDIGVEALDLASIFDLGRVPELRSPANQQRYFMALGAALRVEEKTL